MLVCDRGISHAGRVSGRVSNARTGLARCEWRVMLLLLRALLAAADGGYFGIFGSHRFGRFDAKVLGLFVVKRLLTNVLYGIFQYSIPGYLVFALSAKVCNVEFPTFRQRQLPECPHVENHSFIFAI